MNPLTEEKSLIELAQAGDDEAFTALVEAYQRPVYNVSYRMSGEPETAKEAAHETFLRAYQNLARYDRQRPFATWLLSIAAHGCIDKLRRKRFFSFSIDNEKSWIDLPDPDAPEPEMESARRQDREHLQNCLRYLDPTNRAAVILYFWQGYSEREIAETLNLTVLAVRSRLHRSRRLLAEMWVAPDRHPTLPLSSGVRGESI